MIPKYKQFTALLIGGFSLLSLVGCQSDHQTHQAGEEQLPTAKVSTTTVQVEKAGSLTEVMGTVEAVERATIAARINGHIVELPVLLGSKVKKGDLLVSISAGEISARLLQAQAQLTQAQRNLDREKKLMQKRAATAETVKSLEDVKRIAVASYKEAKTMLGFTRIVAPFDGTITRKFANIGDLATAGKPLLTLENDKSLQVISDIPEALVLQINTGDELPVRIPAAKLDLIGKVTEIAPATDPRSRTAPVKLAIGTYPNIRPGQFARVTLKGGESDVLRVPDSAVSTFGQMERVFVAQDNRARLRLVRSGSRFDSQLEILTGLKDGDTIITRSDIPLHDGQPIITQEPKRAQ